MDSYGIDSKIVIMGNSGVGKTSLLQRYTQNKFDPKNTTSTSGAFFVTKKVVVDGVRVRLQLWDTAGQERFRSMAPMYYRGANAALLLYDITNASTFDDIRGWLQELKKNCPPTLLIYIVGSKADLFEHRQVSPDYARLSLHKWFPPARLMPTQSTTQASGAAASGSTLSYIRPRFTSFPGLRSPPVITSPPPLTSASSTGTQESAPAYLDLHGPHRSGSRVSTSSSRPRTAGSGSVIGSPPHASTSFGYGSRPTAGSNGLTRSNTLGAASVTSRFGGGGSNSISEESEDGEDPDADVDEPQWGLTRHMQLFEVSAKSDVGIETLFGHLISAIIKRRDSIERDNDGRKRDSVLLGDESPNPLRRAGIEKPRWIDQAAGEEARQAREARAQAGWGSCCGS